MGKRFYVGDQVKLVEGVDGWPAGARGEVYDTHSTHRHLGKDEVSVAMGTRGCIHRRIRVRTGMDNLEPY